MGRREPRPAAQLISGPASVHDRRHDGAGRHELTGSGYVRGEDFAVSPDAATPEEAAQGAAAERLARPSGLRRRRRCSFIIVRRRRRVSTSKRATRDS
jgi:hypothetical protein